MRIIRSHFDSINESIKRIDAQIDLLIAPYENCITLLCTIQGVDRNAAIVIISEIGTDMSQFSNTKRLCCWAGLTPGNNESAGKKHYSQFKRFDKIWSILKRHSDSRTHCYSTPEQIRSEIAQYKAKYDKVYSEFLRSKKSVTYLYQLKKFDDNSKNRNHSHI